MQTACGPYLNRSVAPDSKQRVPATLLAKSAFSSLVALGFFLFITLVGCAKETPQVKAAPPDVTVANVTQQNVPIYERVGGAAERPGERRHHAEGPGLPAAAELPERLLRQEGPAAV